MKLDTLIQKLEKIGTIEKQWSNYYNGYYIDAIIKSQRIPIVSDAIIKSASTLTCVWTQEQLKNLVDFCDKIQEKEKVYICIPAKEYRIFQEFNWGEHENLKSFYFSEYSFLTEKEIESLKERNLIEI